EEGEHRRTPRHRAAEALGRLGHRVPEPRLTPLSMCLSRSGVRCQWRLFQWISVRVATVADDGRGDR
ncbi:hypothetical protein AB0H18_33140, partial [Streptomyces sp. NPDC020766]|uniref:hypothetical protein n=1 Tax=Streptomyces sp. NPDC020766 TaxID=3155011 RepID=UPI0033C90108